jgi:hypothetical protein
VEPAGVGAVLDRPFADARLEQLSPAHDPVLPLGERGDQLVRGKRDGFGPYRGHKPSRLAHWSSPGFVDI